MALLTAPLRDAVVLLAFSLFSPEFSPAILATTDRAGLLLLGIAVDLRSPRHRPLLRTIRLAGPPMPWVICAPKLAMSALAVGLGSLVLWAGVIGAGFFLAALKPPSTSPRA